MIKLNIVTNIFTSAILAFFPTMFFPLYLNFFEADEFGLFALYFVLILYFKVLDFGFSTNFNKFTASNYNFEDGKKNIKYLLNSYEFIFIFFSILLFSFIYVFRNSLSSKWFEKETLSISTIEKSLLLFSIIISFRLFISLYRGGINGLEKQVTLNFFKLFFEFSSLIGGLIIFFYFNYLKKFNINYVFIYFIFITFIELITLRIYLLSFIKIRVPYSFSFKPFLNSFKFTLNLGFISFCWFFTLLFERIVFSGSLSLKEFGYYITFSLISGISLLVVVQINTAFFPRASNLDFNNKNKSILKILYYINHLNNSFIFSIAAMLVVFSEQILIVWTGSSQLANWSHIPLSLYALGYIFICSSHTLTTLLTSKGYSKIIMNLNFLWMISLCILFYISSIYLNINWAGFFWLIVNLLLFFLLFYYSNFKLNLKYEIKIILSNFFKNFLIFALISTFSYFILHQFIIYQRLVLFFELILFFLIFFNIFLFSDKKTFKKISKYLKLLQKYSANI